MYKTKRFKEPLLLRQGQSSEATEIYRRPRNDTHQAKWIFSQNTVQRISQKVSSNSVQLCGRKICCCFRATNHNCRYCFLAFGYDERVVANRDNCRLLLVRLKMDGWALGKTKVFLKYYHVEFLSKLYEEQLRKIIMVQACVRRWLAKMKFKKQKWQFAVSVVTLQRHIRGWLSRKYTEKILIQKRADSTLELVPSESSFLKFNKKN